MQQSWKVRAVWVNRHGAASEECHQFGTYADARRELVRLFCHLGLVGFDDRALRALEIDGDYWAAGHSAPDVPPGGGTGRPRP